MTTPLFTAARRRNLMNSASQLRIMIIDDAGLVRLYYRDILVRAGFLVEEALNGLEGLEKLLLRPADLLIVDINMPKMDGFTFLKTLRRQEGGHCRYSGLGDQH